MHILYSKAKDARDDDDGAYFLLSLRRQTKWQHKTTTVSTKMWLLFLLLLDVPLFCNSVGYSYARFAGPVTAPEEKVKSNGIGNVDYVAHPKYQFAYGVEDNEHRVLHNRKETRDGDNVHGVYSVVEPDGSLRVVKYTADDVNGFQAEVITNGIPVVYGNWQAELPSVGESSEDYDSGNENEEEDNVEDEEEHEDGTAEVGSSEEDFEDAEEVNENTNTIEYY